MAVIGVVGQAAHASDQPFLVRRGHRDLDTNVSQEWVAIVHFSHVFLDGRYSAKLNFCETEFHKAAMANER